MCAIPYAVLLLLAVTGSVSSSCSTTEFHCGYGSSRECVPSSYKCDGDNDCGNGQDEAYCYLETAQVETAQARSRYDDDDDDDYYCKYHPENSECKSSGGGATAAIIVVSILFVCFGACCGACFGCHDWTMGAVEKMKEALVGCLNALHLDKLASGLEGCVDKNAGRCDTCVDATKAKAIRIWGEPENRYTKEGVDKQPRKQKTITTEVDRDDDGYIMVTEVTETISAPTKQKQQKQGSPSGQAEIEVWSSSQTNQSTRASAPVPRPSAHARANNFIVTFTQPSSVANFVQLSRPSRTVPETRTAVGGEPNARGFIMMEKETQLWSAAELQRLKAEVGAAKQRVAVAESKVASAKAGVSSAKGELELATKNHAQLLIEQRNATEEAPGPSQADIDQAKRSVEQKGAAVDRAQQKLAEARETMNEVKAQAAKAAALLAKFESC